MLSILPPPGPAVMEEGRSNRLPVNKLWNFHRYWLIGGVSALAMITYVQHFFKSAGTVEKRQVYTKNNAESAFRDAH